MERQVLGSGTYSCEAVPVPESSTWQEAFEGAFGLTVDEFHKAFEAYRAEVAPPSEDPDSS